jgi:hypothetical protein
MDEGIKVLTLWFSWFRSSNFAKFRHVFLQSILAMSFWVSPMMLHARICDCHSEFKVIQTGCWNVLSQFAVLRDCERLVILKLPKLWSKCRESWRLDEKVNKSTRQIAVQYQIVPDQMRFCTNTESIFIFSKPNQGTFTTLKHNKWRCQSDVHRLKLLRSS